jgi:hypothetical protein
LSRISVYSSHMVVNSIHSFHFVFTYYHFQFQIIVASSDSLAQLIFKEIAYLRISMHLLVGA